MEASMWSTVMRPYINNIRFIKEVSIRRVELSYLLPWGRGLLYVGARPASYWTLKS